MLKSGIKNVCGIIIALGASMLYSCTNHNEEELYPITKITCDTSNISFKTVIVPIMANNCYSCHSEATKQDGGGYNFEGYSNIMSYGFINEGNAETSRFYRSTAHLAGALPMPQPEGTAKIPDCDINRIKAWINQGALDN